MSLCLSMIVKNEAHVIRRCLRSVRPFIDSYSISDTGSTDNTIEIIREELADLPGVLTSDPWQDFATNRNIALANCRGDHILSIDADDVLISDDSPLVFSDEYDGFEMRLHFPEYYYWALRIVRNDPRWRWVGAVHEVLMFDGPPQLQKLEHVRMNILGGANAPNDKEKQERYLATLEQQPATARNLFCRGQSLSILHRYEEAAAAYAECARLSTWDEEVYVALWQSAALLRESGHPFEEVADALHKAHCYRPTRLEALVDLCQHLRLHGKFLQSYELSLVTPARQTDKHFVHTQMDWRILEEHALAAINLGRKEEAREYILRVAQYDIPEDARSRTIQNLALCEAAAHTPLPAV